MKRWITTLAAALMLGACTNSPSSVNHGELDRECLFHGALQESGCRYEASELARLSGRHNEPVWVFYGVPYKHGDAYLLQVSNELGAAFMVLEVATYPVTAAEIGLDPLVGWRTRVIGRYTSRDVLEPKVPGASGTLVAVHVGSLHDPDRPWGPYQNFRSELAEKYKKTKAGD